MRDYLIPANSKKSMLKFGLFTMRDLVILAIGAIITFVMLVVVKDGGLGKMLLAIIPFCIAAFLVFPVPHYHNIYQLIENIILFIFGRKKYYWKGWCYKDDKD